MRPVGKGNYMTFLSSFSRSLLVIAPLCVKRIKLALSTIYVVGMANIR